ncbi:MAG: histidine utilization repressor [Holophaga sp.]|nr:histidine utilization repressor [Holophaga sp.]
MSLPRIPGSTKLYQQVKDHIRQLIHDGQWQAGARIPSEHQLVAELGVSRMTVHRALREMAEHGILERFAGVGTFVAEARPQSGLLKITNIAAETRARGHEYRCDVVRVGRESANLEVASALELRTGDGVFHAVCVHRENGVPVQLEDRYVNPRAAPDFIAQDFGRIGFSEYLVQTVPLDEVEHVVDAVQPSAEEAELLEIRSADPCLVLTRRTWSSQVVVTFVRCIHPGTRYRLGSRFQVSGPQWFG